MGFVREPCTEHITVETRRESFKIHADHPWQPKTLAGNPEDHIELPYSDLPALVRELIKVMRENCEMDKA